MTIPECSCRDCLRALVGQHAPHAARVVDESHAAVAAPAQSVPAAGPRWTARVGSAVAPLLPPLGLMALIFMLSSQPHLDSGLGAGDVIGRKMIHLAEYALLFTLWWRALRIRVAPPAAVARAFVIALGYGVTDELHQLFVAGRHGSPVDVAIDLAGVVVGMTLVRHRADIVPRLARGRIGALVARRAQG